MKTLSLRGASLDGNLSGRSLHFLVPSGPRPAPGNYLARVVKDPLFGPVVLMIPIRSHGGPTSGGATATVTLRRGASAGAFDWGANATAYDSSHMAAGSFDWGNSVASFDWGNSVACFDWGAFWWDQDRDAWCISAQRISGRNCLALQGGLNDLVGALGPDPAVISVG